MISIRQFSMVVTERARATQADVLLLILLAVVISIGRSLFAGTALVYISLASVALSRNASGMMMTGVCLGCFVSLLDGSKPFTWWGVCSAALFESSMTMNLAVRGTANPC